MERQTNSQKKIKAAFIQLTREKGFDSLTVTDIARQARINRGTFYRHYVDKYDLLEQLKADIYKELQKIFLNDMYQEEAHADLIPYQTILKAITYLQENFLLIATLASSNGDPNFMVDVKSIIKELITSRIQKENDFHLSTQDLPMEYAIEVLISSVTSVINLWIQRGGQESPEEVANIIFKAKSLAPKDLLI
ncbi:MULTISPECIES: TetR/AcrR family transcriptional regulator C-terminal domain-containing protein [Aerococcus]|uniref:TetR/AcrR family transcriptional regulator n=1 Tax=Aerococcus mictus TaxID=2976810 RepID=A0A1E9PJU5_9LACT|nr:MULTISPECIES: TetR/AcrR family transcriptional regulator C-terminal domain-containing protein [Aerococcus]MBU5610615.1 TetR/AcrR family transcriptional regulator [Aerococcus urinae]KAA9290826.1 TetR family transcriptional regulator [Aerococcus mictus]MCY3031456.1 TetR/AcrR family transcriptional regulator [Aerococcus sp. Group 1]MCY3039719.1 TetR/AcrR family transcriptional regulator [Aerococcus sp. Group 2]MCY3041527.1 TetR/AcrR family transcriptional regulator [Aerococcus sp. Group 2]